jgi:hypothetical protein
VESLVVSICLIGETAAVATLLARLWWSVRWERTRFRSLTTMAQVLPAGSQVVDRRADGASVTVIIAESYRREANDG